MAGRRSGVSRGGARKGFAIGLPAAVVLALIPATAASAASHTTIYVVSKTQPGTSTVDSTCPPGSRGISGGFGLPGLFAGQPLIPASGPIVAGMSIDQLPDGPASTSIDGWRATVRAPGAASESLQTAAICRATNGTIGTVQPVIVSATVPGSQRLSVSSQCIGSRVAIGGAWTTTNPGIETSAPDINGATLDSIADGTYGSPSGWTVNLANPLPGATRLWIAALCADQTTLATPITVVGSKVAAPNAPGGLAVACPSGMEAVGGGVASATGLGVLANGPTAGTNLGNHPDGAAGSADGWEGSAFNPTANPAVVKVAAICLSTMKEVLRLGGTDRIDTAINVSKFLFPTGGATPPKTVVLARADAGQFADALVGQPLAFAKGGPILLTPSTSLDPRTQAEIQRLLPAGGTVRLLGGTVAITPAVENQLVALGYTIVRYGGADRFATAAIIADQGLGNPTTVFETTGLDFADALTAGAAASHLTASVLLTAGSTLPGPTAAYLAAHPPVKRYAVGGPAATADPSATAESGSDRYATSAVVAANLFSAPTVAGLATGLDYPDALSGGTFMSFSHGPLVLVQPDAVPPTVASYLKTNGSTLIGGYLFGGITAVSETTRVAIGQAMEP